MFLLSPPFSSSFSCFCYCYSYLNSFSSISLFFLVSFFSRPPHSSLLSVVTRRLVSSSRLVTYLSFTGCPQLQAPPHPSGQRPIHPPNYLHSTATHSSSHPHPIRSFPLNHSWIACTIDLRRWMWSLVIMYEMAGR